MNNQVRHIDWLYKWIQFVYFACVITAYALKLEFGYACYTVTEKKLGLIKCFFKVFLEFLLPGVALPLICTSYLCPP